MKITMIFCMLLLTAGCCTSGVGRSELDRTADCPWQLAGSGTCWPVKCTYDKKAKDWVLTMITAGHVAKAIARPMIAQHRDGRVLSGGKILSIHPTEDAALVQFRCKRKIWPVRIDFEPLAWGEWVVVPGFQGMSPWVVQGYASGPDRCSTPMFGGGSGSPVLDANYRARALVVAVSAYYSPVGGRQLVHHHCHVLPLSKIRSWLCSALK